MDSLAQEGGGAGLAIPQTLGVTHIDVFEATGGLVHDGNLSDINPGAGSATTDADTSGTTDPDDTEAANTGLTSILEPTVDYQTPTTIIQNIHQTVNTTTITTTTAPTTDSPTTTTEKTGLGGGVGGGRTQSGGIGQGVGGGQNNTGGVDGGDVGGGNGDGKKK